MASPTSPSAHAVSPPRRFVANSGNVYTLVNGIIKNVAPSDITSLIKLGLRQVGGPDAGATLPWATERFH